MCVRQQKIIRIKSCGEYENVKTMNKNKLMERMSVSEREREREREREGGLRESDRSTDRQRSENLHCMRTHACVSSFDSKPQGVCCHLCGWQIRFPSQLLLHAAAAPFVRSCLKCQEIIVKWGKKLCRTHSGHFLNADLEVEVRRS